MIPAGYMFKRVVQRPEWIKASNVADIYSLSGCVSEYFSDYIKHWKHNGYWLFDSPRVMEEIAKAASLDLSDVTLFYYEVFEQEFNEDSKTWSTFESEPSFPLNVEKPQQARLAGYDVTTFSVRTSPECSPLSCCHLAEEIAVNRHCLFESFEAAKRSLTDGKFDHSEPGPFRIFAIYTLGY